ncbi:MAG: hypothetical protein DRQ47_10960 [Gammaproteobacteria bacterium]|nr:MAG: hypothetical protein DRQ47_10960 [Gammaproteobacteria bacterium]
MESEFLKFLLEKFGPWAVAIIILIFVAWTRKTDHDKDKTDHREDRNQWIKQTQKQAETVIDVVKNNTEALGKVEATMQMCQKK